MPTHTGQGKQRRTSYVYRHPPNDDGERCFWHVPADLIERAAIFACAEVLQDNQKLKAAIEHGLRESMSDAAHAEAEAAELATEIARTRRRLERVINELTAHDHRGPARDSLRSKMAGLDSTLKDLLAAHATSIGKAEALSVSPGQAADIANRLRILCGLKGSLPLLAMTAEQHRLLVTLVVGRAARDAKEGIFVRMLRFGKKQHVYWEWELRGALAQVNGSTSRYDAFDDANTIKRIEFDDASTAMQLAQLARAIKPMGLLPYPSSS